MSDKELDELLDQLRTKLKNLNADSAVEQDLSQLIASIEREIESLEDNYPHESMIESLKRYALEWESEHPAIVATVNDIMVKLSGMGI